MPNNPWTGPLPFQPPGNYQPQGGGLPPSYFNPAAGNSAPGSASPAQIAEIQKQQNAALQKHKEGATGHSTVNGATTYGTSGWQGVVPPRPTMPSQPNIPMMPQTQSPQTPTAPSGPAMPPINAANIPPMYLPTRQSQNMLMAKAAQQASPGNAINRLVGNTGVQSSSGTVLGQLAKPMIDSYREGASGAAALGIDDQLLRDQHILRGILGHGQADIGAARAAGNRDRIGIDGQNQITNSMVNLLRSLGGMFNTNNLLGSAGDIGGLF